MSPRRRARRSLPGRIFEALANLVLVLIVLLFGFSIAGRFSAEGRDAVRKARPQETRPAVRAAAGDTVGASAGAGAPREPAARPGVPLGAVTIDVRNGCGRVRLAEDMTRELRRAGFDVVEYRSAERYDYEKTLVKDRAGKPEAAARVRSWLQREYGVGEVQQDRVASPGADVLLILGADLADTLRHRERSAR
jgi:hypothetical protein